MVRSAIVAVVANLAATASGAQTRSVRDTATAYGARLDAKGRRADTNPARIDNRIDSRLDNRLSLRIERYYPEKTGNPTVVFRAAQDDKSRLRPVVAPLPQEDDPS